MGRRYALVLSKDRSECDRIYLANQDGSPDYPIAEAYGTVGDGLMLAAAPELYAALETCLAIGGKSLKKAMNLSGQSPYDIGLAAIAKARGEA